MITLLRSNQRRLVEQDGNATWLTIFSREGPASPDHAFGVLASLVETRLAPRAVSPLQVHEGALIVSYMHRGAMTQQDSRGHGGVLHSGEFQRMMVERLVRHVESNGSETTWAHLFRIFLLPSVLGIEDESEQRHIAVAQRRNLLCTVASPDGRHASLRIPQDVFLYSSILDPGHHLVCEIQPGRSVWMHVVEGEATQDLNLLSQGDAVGVSGESSLSLTARQETEILLIDVASNSRVEPPCRPCAQ